MLIKDMLTHRTQVVKEYKSSEEYDEYLRKLTKYHIQKEQVVTYLREEAGKLGPPSPREPEHVFVFKKRAYDSPVTAEDIDLLLSTLARYTTTMENRYYKSLKMYYALRGN